MSSSIRSITRGYCVQIGGEWSYLLIILLFHVHVVSCQNLGLGRVCRSSARSLGNHVAALVNKFKVITAEKVRYSGKLGTVALGVVVEFEEGHGKQLHVLWDTEHLCVYQVSLLSRSF